MQRVDPTAENDSNMHRLSVITPRMLFSEAYTCFLFLYLTRFTSYNAACHCSIKPIYVMFCDV